MALAASSKTVQIVRVLVFPITFNESKACRMYFVENTEKWMKSDNSGSCQLSFDFYLRPAENAFLSSYSHSKIPVRVPDFLIVQ